MQKRIIVVDDSESIRQLLMAILGEAGYAVDSAVDGQHALEILPGEQYHLMLTDLNMPRMDGISLIRQVRSHDKFKGMPIVMLTTESQTALKDQAKAAGATGWIVKPFVANKLLAVVSKVIR